ncbi:hypothetical protein HPB50_023274 [Hyalomma asiaticum]|uniref:Uncharacterized protein n=1 Tax=Hyalomma asiaticum TaxID=266040 RepID=A0ACB7S2G5_HYAAI|nr:hypothetical protein HPB50_023274 [Hyalomma asiaticum]
MELPHCEPWTVVTSGTSGNFIHTFADVALPDFARRVLSMGPKFAVPPRSTGRELVTYVRQVSRFADGADVERQMNGVALADEFVSFILGDDRRASERHVSFMRLLKKKL